MIPPALGPGPQLPGKQRTFVLYREQLWEWDSLTVKAKLRLDPQPRKNGPLTA